MDSHPNDPIIHAILDAIESPIALLGKDKTVELANDAARRLGIQPRQTLADAPLSSFASLVEMARGTQMPAAGSLDDLDSLLRAGARLFLPRVAPLRDAELLLTLTDVTAQLADRENRNRSLSSISHRFLTPMTSIQMCLLLLIEDTQEPATARQLDLLKTAAEDADKLHHQLQLLLAAERGA